MLPWPGGLNFSWITSALCISKGREAVMVNMLMYGLLTGGLLLLAGKATSIFRTTNTAERLTFSFSSFKIKTTKGLTIVFQLGVKASNPTENALTIEQPEIKVYYQGKLLGTSPAQSKKIILEPRKTSAVEIAVEFQATNYLRHMPDMWAYVLTRLKGAKPSRWVKIEMYGVANGNTVPGMKLMEKEVQI
jgi:hypothetical protein